MRSMGHPRPVVKSRRAYDATFRRERARRRQESVIEAAERRFLRNGYGMTTIAAIADDAGVSVDTVYKSFGGKPGLVRAIRDRALRGRGLIPAEQRSDEMQGREPDPRKIIKAWGQLTTEVAPRSAPILLLVRDAAGTDSELHALLEEMDSDRMRRMADNARRLHATGRLRSDITVAHAADVLWTYSSPELFELLVLRRGMPLEKYGQFIADAMISTLL